VKTLATHLGEAETSRDALLVSMVQDLRGRILMAERGEQLFQPVVDAEREALERRAALAGTNAEYDRRAKDLDSQNADLRRAAEQQQGLVQQRRGEAEARRQVFERAEARRKRLYIELRPLAEATERGVALTAAQENRIGELEYEIERQKPECENATRALQIAMAAVETAENEEEQFWKRVRAVQVERQALDQEFKKEIGASSAGVEAAEKKRDIALANVGREVLAAKGRVVDVSVEGRRALLKADAVVIERSLEFEKGLRAIDVYDRDGYRNGVLFVSAVAMGLVAIVLFILVLH
jgi:hypothetical protein